LNRYPLEKKTANTRTNNVKKTKLATTIKTKYRREESLKALQRKNTPLYQSDLEAFNNLK